MNTSTSGSQHSSAEFTSLAQDNSPAKILEGSIFSHAKKASPKIACVIPAYNEAANLPKLLPQLSECLQQMTTEFEILLVDDGSHDRTFETAAEFSQRFPIKVLQLSRNFGKEAAITAGLEHADGDVIILMDGDCQHTTDVLPKFLKLWREGYDMVYGVRTGREDEPFWKRHLSDMFYSLMRRATSVPIIPDAGDFRLMDRRVVDAINKLPERTRFMKGLYAWVGFKSIGCDFDVQDRYMGKSTFNFKRLIQLALTGLVSFSDVPLRVWTTIGAFLSLLSIFYGIYIIIETMLYGIGVPGFATIVVGITFLGGIQLLSIGVLGEYIGRIFNEVKHRPIYIVANKVGFEERVGFEGKAGFDEKQTVMKSGND